MFGWFRSKAVCPIDSATREWVEFRWKWLDDEFGQERQCVARTILPNYEFFPDPYHRKEEDVRRMLDRICEYMEIDSRTIEMSLYEDRNPLHVGKFRQGTGGLYEKEKKNKFRIWIEITNLDDPLAMAATIAHELGHVISLGHGRISKNEEDHEPLTDLLTVYLGMGVITANAVIRESSWQSGNWHGWSMKKRGYLGMPIYAYALARYALARNEKAPTWSRELRLDVRSVFNEALRFLAEEKPPERLNSSQ